MAITGTSFMPSQDDNEPLYEVCKQCDGTGQADKWDDEQGDCLVCMGEGELPLDTR